jgi:hypothetical protein
MIKTLKDIVESQYLINYYKYLFKKGINEFPIGKLIVDKCRVERMREGDEEGCFLYHCIFKRKIYQFNASCNQELLEFVQMVVSEQEKKKKIHQ